MISFRAMTRLSKNGLYDFFKRVGGCIYVYTYAGRFGFLDCKIIPALGGLDVRFVDIQIP